eukprot:SAG31_NODE_9450_length_1275_cov_1.510204_1_plen_42_part_10
MQPSAARHEKFWDTARQLGLGYPRVLVRICTGMLSLFFFLFS